MRQKNWQASTTWPALLWWIYSFSIEPLLSYLVTSLISCPTYFSSRMKTKACTLLCFTLLSASRSRVGIVQVNMWNFIYMNLREWYEDIINSPLSHGGHIGYDVCTLGMKSRRLVSNLRFAAINHAKQRSFQCALMCPCARITDQKVN